MWLTRAHDFPYECVYIHMSRAVLQCVAVCCKVFPPVSVCFCVMARDVLQCVAVRCNVFPPVSVCFCVLHNAGISKCHVTHSRMWLILARDSFIYAADVLFWRHPKRLVDSKRALYSLYIRNRHVLTIYTLQHTATHTSEHTATHINRHVFTIYTKSTHKHPKKYAKKNESPHKHWKKMGK